MIADAVFACKVMNKCSVTGVRSKSDRWISAINRQLKSFCFYGRKNITSRGMVSMDSRVVMKVTSVMRVVSLPWRRQRMVP